MAQIDLITRTVKKYYEEMFLTADQRQIYSMLFPTVDSDTTENFLLDTYIQNPYGVQYRHADTQSSLRPFVNGEGQLIRIPRASEKTPIGEDLLAKVAVGLESTAGFGQNEAAIIGRIVRDHIAGHFMTKNKQALEVLDTGIFRAHGVDGESLDIKYGRKASLSMTYNFTAVGASFSQAIGEQQEELRANGIPLSNMVMLCGDNWLTEYSADTESQEAAQNNALNQLVVNPMTPGLLNGTSGVYVVGQLRSRKMLAPVWIASYSPGVSYKANRDDVGTPFLDENKALMFSLDDERFNIQRGLRVKDSNGEVRTVSGDVVFDKFSSDDPTTTFLRSATRHALVPANINHTASTTGTFE